MTGALPDATRAIAARHIAAKRRGMYATSNWAETYGLRDTMLEMIGRAPRAPRVIFDRVRGEWGSVDTRRLWRALRWLLSRGKIVRVGTYMRDDVGYARSRHGGAETDQDRLARLRIDLKADGRCYVCREPREMAAGRPHRCVRCATEAREQYARNRKAKRQAAAAEYASWLAVEAAA